MYPQRLKHKKIIGFGHQMQVGKDTAGDLLCRQYGFRTYKFADCLKDVTCRVFGWDRAQLEEQDFKSETDRFWDITPRRALQLIGTDAMRNHVRPDIWVKALERQLQTYYAGNNIVITDVRFPNEADAILRWGGKVIRIDRPDFSSDDPEGHASETALLPYERWSGVINNDGSIIELEAKVVAELQRLGTTLYKAT